MSLTGTVGAAIRATPTDGSGTPAPWCDSRIWSRTPAARTHNTSTLTRRLGGPLNVTAAVEADLVLAVNEAASNVVDHAYHTPPDLSFGAHGSRSPCLNRMRWERMT
jgi:hypothetical protein